MSTLATYKKTNSTHLFEKISSLGRLFLFIVVLPTLVAALYYFVIASDIYVSESQFVVRSPSRSSSGGSSALAQMMGGSSFSPASAESYPVINYLRSRDAVDQLKKNIPLIDMYSVHGDVISRYHTGWKDNLESLWKYYNRRIIDVDVDDETSIITLKTMAYKPGDAQILNRKLLEMGEYLINQMNVRAMHDAVDLADSEVAIANKKVIAAAVELSQYRQTSGTYNPDQQTTLAYQQVALLESRIYTTQAQIDQLKIISPDNPQLNVLYSSLKTLKQQSTSITSGIVGGEGSLSQKGPNFTEMQLNLEFASQQLGMALASLEASRTAAQRKQLYLERIVQPNFPTDAIKPSRIYSVCTVLLCALLAWAVIKMFVDSVKDHKD